MTADRFIIIYDTYCGWCYGAAPMFDALVESGVEVEVLHRNLFRDLNRPRLSDGKGAAIIESDAKIAALTGRHFSQSYIDGVVLSQSEVLDSTYTAHAAALVHELGVEREFSLRKRLENNRFTQGISAQDRDSVVNALLDEGLSENSACRVGSEDLAKVADATASRASQLMSQVGSTSVPTILRVSDGTLEVIDHSAYYGNPTAIKQLATRNANPVG